MSELNNKNFVATAFISCSLREEDMPFINYIEEILIAHNIKPIGTVGRHSLAPTNTALQMKENIPLADFVVIVATPRYVQRDIKTGKQTYGLSETVHVEAGMAYMAGKPVLAFVQEGTNLGNFLPNVTQYITLTGDQNDLHTKWSHINNLIGNTFSIVQKIKGELNNKSVLKVVTTGFAIYGAIKLVQAITKKDK